MIRGAEIISGGASATYGADALAGVSNMQLRRDFTGLETDLQWGVSEVGDNKELRASVIAGTKIADNRGSLVFAAEYYNRDGAFDKNRRFYTDAYADPTVGGNFLGFIFGANGYNTTGNAPSSAALGAAVGKPAIQRLALQSGFVDLCSCRRQLFDLEGCSQRRLPLQRRECV
jgi:outer membrane receptor protein involved in Fe transport